MAYPSNVIQQRQKGSNGFTLVEVLIATLIMVIAIVTVTAAIRQFALQREKLHHYEQLYTTVLSLRDQLMAETLREGQQDSGRLNGLDYRYDCQRTESANNYVISDEAAFSGNRGAFALTLFKVHMEVGGRDFEFYKTQYKKRSATTQDEAD